ncbi:MAG: DUF1127 domain-containing protein [Acetobacteraceae bacterium]|nr:DUF1127 domain-containing protein [Acetobacteraceae bacterium]
MSYRTLEGVSPTLFGDAALRDRMNAARSAMDTALRTIVTRRELVELDERALADIGLTRAEALAEAKRNPWNIEPPRRPERPRRIAMLVGMVQTQLREAWRRHRSRQAITGLNARMLKDIGVSYAEAECEANKAFWRR